MAAGHLLGFLSARRCFEEVGEGDNDKEGENWKHPPTTVNMFIE